MLIQYLQVNTADTSGKTKRSEHPRFLHADQPEHFLVFILKFELGNHDEVAMGEAIIACH